MPVQVFSLARIVQVTNQGTIARIISGGTTVRVTAGGPIGPQGDTGPLGPRIPQVQVSDDIHPLTPGSKARLRINALLDGWSLTAVAGSVLNPSSSGAVTVQLVNVRTGQNMLTTPLTIDVGESDSLTAATPPVVSLLNAEVLEADKVRIDVVAAGTDVLGLIVDMTFEP